MTITLEENNRIRINHEIRMLGQRLDKSVPTHGNIVFPATQVASTNANTLDDYEEGTFTPSFAFGGASVGMTFGSRGGLYTKIGDTVFCHLFMVLTAKGSSTGAVTITGLPFTVGTRQAGASIGLYEFFTGLTGVLICLADVGGTTMRLFQTGAASCAAITDTSLTNTSSIYMSFNYKV